MAPAGTGGPGDRQDQERRGQAQGKERERPQELNQAQGVSGQESDTHAISKPKDKGKTKRRQKVRYVVMNIRENRAKTSLM